MPDCSLSLLERHLLPTLAGGVAVLLLAWLLCHRVMQTFLEARGVQPWSAFDSFGAAPLVLAGAAAVGGATTLASGLFVNPCASYAHTTAAEVAAIALAITGLMMLHFGLLALRRLT